MVLGRMRTDIQPGVVWYLGGVWCFSPWPGVAHWCCWADRWHGWRWSALRDGVVSLLPLMLFPEGFLNGVIVTVLVGFRPQWIWSFRDEE